MIDTKTGLDSDVKRKIVGVLLGLFPGARIYLYGSRARGTHYERSDIDIAIDLGKKLNFVDVGEARDMFRESNIQYSIDVVDLHGIPDYLKEEILKEGIVWSE